MDPLVWLLLLCLAMAIGSFVAGSVPLSFQLSEERLKVVSAFGAGILVGTAFIVILPEGVETLYHGDSQEEYHVHRFTGPALIAGFLTMMLIQQLSPGHSHPQRLITSTGAHIENDGHARFSSAFIGILVHAAADGMALGGAAIHDDPDLEMIVFFAILLHKAPSAFGMTSFMLAEGATRKTVRQQLFLFSITAPISALATYALLKWIPVSLPQHIWTGLVILFSAGSFMFVALMHVLPEVYHSQSHDQNHPKSLSLVHFLTLMAGMLTPLAMQMDHGH